MDSADRTRRLLNAEINSNLPDLKPGWQSRFEWEVSKDRKSTTVVGYSHEMGTIESWQIAKDDNGVTVTHTDVIPGVQAVAHESPQGFLSGRVERVPPHSPIYQIDFIDESRNATAYEYTHKDDRGRQIAISNDRVSKDIELLFETLLGGRDAFTQHAESSAASAKPPKAGAQAKLRF